MFFLAKPYFDLLFKSVWSWEAWGYKALKGDVRLGLSGAIYLSSDLRQRYEEILSSAQWKFFMVQPRERVKTWKMSTVIMHSNITSWQKCILFHTFFHTSSQPTLMKSDGILFSPKFHRIAHSRKMEQITHCKYSKSIVMPQLVFSQMGSFNYPSDKSQLDERIRQRNCTMCPSVTTHRKVISVQATHVEEES